MSGHLTQLAVQRQLAAQSQAGRSRPPSPKHLSLVSAGFSSDLDPACCQVLLNIHPRGINELRDDVVKLLTKDFHYNATLYKRLGEAQVLQLFKKRQNTKNQQELVLCLN